MVLIEQNTNKKIKEAKKCDECLCWLKYCKAECCKTVTIDTSKLPVGTFTLKNNILSIKCRLNPEMEWYYTLHGFKYVHGLLRIPLCEFEQSGNILVIKARCKLLTDSNLCSRHDDKPKICKELDLETCHEPRFRITPNCLFKYKKMDDKIDEITS